MSIQSVKALIKGVEYSFTFNETTGKWVAQGVAPPESSFNQDGGYYGVTITATDVAENSKTIDVNDPVFGDTLKLVVRERIKPVITILSPGESAYVTTDKPSITFRLRDDAIGGDGDSGINLESLSLTINGGSTIDIYSEGLTMTPEEGGYHGLYIPEEPLIDGSNVVTINVSDNDGNDAIQASRTFIVDTVAPTLDVDSPSEDFTTNEEELTISGSAGDVTSLPVTVTILLNGNDTGPVILDEDGRFEHEIVLNPGVNTITIRATDSAGKYTEIIRSVRLHTSAPEFISVSIVPNPVDAGQTYIIEVEVVEGGQ